jgi:hypothetical protein
MNHWQASRARKNEGSNMTDILMTVIVVGLGTVTWGLLALCDRLLGGDKRTTEL